MKQICCKIRIVEARSVIPITFCFVGGGILLFNNPQNDICYIDNRLEYLEIKQEIRMCE